MIPGMAARSEQRKKLVEWAVPIAVEIAAKNGSVSPRGLIEELNLTKSDAKLVLAEAQRLGLMYQAVSGRCILYPEQARQILAHGAPNVAMQLHAGAAAEASFDARPSDMGVRSGSKIFAIISFLIVLGLLAWVFTTYQASNAAKAPEATQLRITLDAQSPTADKSKPAPESAPAPELDTRPAAPAERNGKRQYKERRRGDGPIVPNTVP